MPFPRRVLASAVAVALTTQLTACGTIFYPERRGQIDGRLDPAIVVLDAVGLLFYLIPGVIAFAVDFATGAIYLPGGYQANIAPEKLDSVVDSDGQVNLPRLQALIEQETGRHLPLDDPRLHIQHGDAGQLASLNQLKAG